MHRQRFQTAGHATEHPSSGPDSLTAERRFHAIFEQTTVAMAYMDTQGNVQEVNRHFCEILGYENEELLQQGFLDATHLEGAEAERDYLRSTLATSASPPHVRETRYVRKDGNSAWVNLTLSPVYLKNDILYCITCIIEDISQRKQLEEQLLLSEQQAYSHSQQLDAIFKIVSDDLIVYNTQGQITHMNPTIHAALLGKNLPADYTNQSISERSTPYAIMDENGDPLSLAQIPVMRVLQGEELTGNYSIDIMLREENAEEIKLHVGGAPLRNQKGQISGAVCIFHDVTERQRMQKELEASLSTLQQTNVRLAQVNAMQSDFIAIVSHEFRTTLTGIQGFSELLRDEVFDVTEVKEYANDINADALRLNRMITKLLDLERLKSGKIGLHLSKVDINRILEEVAERMLLNAPDYTLRLDIDESLPQFEGDYDKLMQLATSLVSNAVKYSPAHSEIFLKSGQEANAIHIVVQDQGIGIPQDALETIFAPNTRIHSAKTHYIQGNGLELAIVQQIVQMHEGHIWAESKPGNGTAFHITLPIKLTNRVYQGQ